MNDIEKAIETLRMDNALMEFNPSTGEKNPIELQNKDNQDLYKANLVAIEVLEKQLNNGWIPTSERLPNEHGNYQITNHNEDVEEATFVPSMNRGLIYGWSVCHADGTHFVDNDYVKAWQPLPEPWEESVKE